jgi:hypothetical protein
VVSGLPNRPGPEEIYGWPEDPHKEFVHLDGELRGSGGKLVAVEIHIDYHANPPNLYLWAGVV